MENESEPLTLRQQADQYSEIFRTMRRAEVIAYLDERYIDFRIWTPGTMGTMDHRPTRLNVRFDYKGDFQDVYWG